MSEAMTVYCKSSDFTAIINTLSSKQDWKIATTDSSKVQLITPQGQITINSLFPSVGGKFGKVYMGTLNQVRRIPWADETNKNQLHNAIKSTEMILGCVVEPDFGNRDERFDAIFEVARLAQGVIFDGFTFLNAEGEIIVTIEGKTSL